MDSTHADVARERQDIVAGASLAPGTYALQNKSNLDVLVWLMDAAVADLDTLDIADAIVIPGQDGGARTPDPYTVQVVGSGDAVYVGLNGTDPYTEGRTATLGIHDG